MRHYLITLTLLAATGLTIQSGHKPQKPQIRMARAISRGNFKRVQAILSQDPSMINRPYSGLSPLLRAALVTQTTTDHDHPRLKILALLAAQDPHPGQPGPQLLDTALHYASLNPAALDTLLSNLPDHCLIPNYLKRKDARGRTPYDWAKQAQQAESIWLMEQWERNAYLLKQTT